MATKGASVSPRLRLSAWVDPQVFMNGKTTDITNPDGTVTRNVFVPDTRKGIDSLFKKDALVDVAIIDGKTVIDDISLIKTFRDDDTPNLKLGWDRAMLQGGSDTLRKEFFQKVIDHCHHVLGTQCLVGFDRKVLHIPRTPTTPGKDLALATWLKADNPSPSAESLAKKWVETIEADLPLYDGISFDLEGVTSNGKLDVVKRNAFAFYQAFAKLLTKAEIQNRNAATPVLGFDHIVAIAAGNLIGEIGGAPMKKSRLLKHASAADASASGGKIKEGELLRDAGGNFISATTPLDADFWEAAQDYTLGKGISNLIIRTMSYDNFRNTDTADVQRRELDDWHTDLVRFFLTMPEVTFQLGVKTIDGDGQKAGGMAGVMANVGATEGERIKHVAERCTNLLHPSKIGLCLFPSSLSFWKRANAALNPNVLEAGSTNMPLQAPIDNTVVGLLTKGGGPQP